ncbi:MAG: primase-helicase zinc-binding domain-containing protein, partial [Devosia sp.]
MSLRPELEALKAEALATSCIGWATRKRWKLSPGLDRAGPCPVCGGTDRFAIHTGKDTFNCRKCGLSGHGVIDLVVKTEHVEFVPACEIITGRKAST